MSLQVTLCPAERILNALTHIKVKRGDSVLTVMQREHAAIQPILDDLEKRSKLAAYEAAAKMIEGLPTDETEQDWKLRIKLAEQIREAAKKV